MTEGVFSALSQFLVHVCFELDFGGMKIYTKADRSVTNPRLCSFNCFTSSVEMITLTDLPDELCFGKTY